jgi:hypothetical protein
MGVVYLARHLLLKEIQIVKTIQPRFASDPEFRERFLREARAAANLRQVALFDGVFFLTDLVGATIAFRLDRSRPWVLWRLFWQRFVYRQLMYAVLWKSLLSALKGLRLGWGKLERKATVSVRT